MQETLFQSQSQAKKRPLAHRVRPSRLEEFKGQDKVFKRYPFLKGQEFPSIILWGPPGCGKTTLAALLAENANKDLFKFNAVLNGVAELKKTIEKVAELEQLFDKQAIIFIDEIHRFNKAQQDALLPAVETGDFTLIGATTENPRTSINKALISRVQIIKLEAHDDHDIEEILVQALKKIEFNLSDELINYIARFSDGDARKAINALEALEQSGSLEKGDLTIESAQTLIHGHSRDYDKNQDRHYDVISAFIKSMRGSDPQAAVLWLAVMLDGGEDPFFIARRLVIFASEDIGNSDPQALTLAISALQSVQHIGMPEARIPLAQATTYLASTTKSNASYLAINEAMAYVKNNPTIDVPTHLRNHHPDKNNYLYPHNYDGHYIAQNYGADKISPFYSPSEQGVEKRIKERLKSLSD